MASDDTRRADIERAARAAAERIAVDSGMKGMGYCPTSTWMARVIVEELDKAGLCAGTATGEPDADELPAPPQSPVTTVEAKWGKQVPFPVFQIEEDGDAD